MKQITSKLNKTLKSKITAYLRASWSATMRKLCSNLTMGKMIDINVVGSMSITEPSSKRTLGVTLVTLKPVSTRYGLQPCLLEGRSELRSEKAAKHTRDKYALQQACWAFVSLSGNTDTMFHK